MVTVFLADGFEEMEAVVPIDILRRGGVAVRTCSITDSRRVMGAHQIPFEADFCIGELTEGEDVILLPGGMPGTLHLKQSEVLCDRIRKHYLENKLLAAICAAPTVYGSLGLLEEEAATCYPGFEGELNCRVSKSDAVVESGRFITARGPGCAVPFAMKLLERLAGKEIRKSVFSAMCFEGDLN